MWFMGVHPSHFLITFWYWGAYNDSFWNVRVMTCCVFNNRHLLSLQLWPTLLCEMIFEYKWIGNSLWCEKKEHWIGSGWWSHSSMSWLSDLGPVTLSLWASSVKWSIAKLSLSLVQLEQPSSLLKFFRMDWDVLCLTSTRARGWGKTWTLGCKLE